MDFAARQRARASTGGSSMISDAGSTSMLDVETEAKLTFAKVSSESYGMIVLKLRLLIVLVSTF
jgi:hypothetical protein